MARISFSSENRRQTGRVDFPKFKLKKDERARILILDEPEVFYVHELRKPEVDEQGIPVMGKATSANGEEYEVLKRSFVANPLCTGNDDTLDEEGIDPANCKVCAQAEKFPKRYEAPRRRYVVHVLRYRTKAGTFNLATPFALEPLVWSFTDKKFNSLIDIVEEHGDLTRKDLLIGPCTNENFQNFDIAVGSDAAILASEDRAKLAQETLDGGRIPDLSVAAGRAKEERFLLLDIKLVNEAWDAVDAFERRSAGAQAAPAQTSTSLGEDLSSLIDDVNEVAQAPAEPEATKAPEESSSDALEGLLEDETVDTTTGEISTPDRAKSSSESTPVVDLEDLLNI